MSTQYVTLKILPDCNLQLPPKMSENKDNNIRETCSDWLRFYMVDQYRLTLHTHISVLIFSYFRLYEVDDGFTLQNYVTLIIYLQGLWQAINGGTPLDFCKATLNYSFKTSSVLLCKITSLQG